ncbi:Aurofusarin biosynthesis regulatory protein aurR1 [Fusarium oxysporum f. sp. albedinis]|nr:Aurofusarin biosynthesis regulatory protein aurR1 [Fusarium oxysporum f. sp. albedinis]
MSSSDDLRPAENTRSDIRISPLFHSSAFMKDNKGYRENVLCSIANDVAVFPALALPDHGSTTYTSTTARSTPGSHCSNSIQVFQLMGATQHPEQTCLTQSSFQTIAPLPQSESRGKRLMKIRQLGYRRQNQSVLRK